MFESLVVGEVGTDKSDEIKTTLTKVNISLTMDQASQLSFTVSDPDLKMYDAGYFVIRRPVTYGDLGYHFEMSAVEVNLESGSPPSVNVDCRTAPIQKLKRDKGAKSWGSISPSTLASMLADEFGMGFFGETSAAKGAIARAQNENTDESSWDVLGRLAGDIQFVCFESGNILYFASEKNLVSTQPHVTFQWPSPARDPFFLHSLTVRRSDDDVWGGDLQAKVGRLNGVRLRPGMTVDLQGVEYFTSRYFMIDSVEWDEGSPDPVSVSARMLEATPDVGCETKTWKLGDTGDCVKRIQQILVAAKLGVAVAVNGTFDAATENAVKALQAKYDLDVTGIVDRAVWAVMVSAPEALSVANCGRVTLRRGNTGNCVTVLQGLLNDAGASLTVNGTFGADTETAVEAFQEEEGLEVTGVVDADTWEALGLEIEEEPAPSGGRLLSSYQGGGWGADETPSDYYDYEGPL